MEESTNKGGFPMAQLTGSRLLTYVDYQQALNPGSPKKDLVLGAGFTRANGNPSFTAFYTELIKAKVQFTAEQSPGSKATQGIITAIKNRNNYVSKYDEVVNYTGFVDVFYHNSLIAIINFNINKVTVYNNGHYTKSTKDRLNRILMHLCGVKLFQKNKRWIIDIAGLEDFDFVEGMTIDMI
jgi:hypothetical protein